MAVNELYKYEDSRVQRAENKVLIYSYDLKLESTDASIVPGLFSAVEGFHHALPQRQNQNYYTLVLCHFESSFLMMTF